MYIELFFDPFSGRIVAYRKNWKKNGIPPKNIFYIDKKDEKDIIFALDHYAILGTKQDFDLNSGNLYIKVIDNMAGAVLKGKFMENALQNK